MTKSAKWAVAEAKAHFSEVIEKAQKYEPQTITRHGKPAAVVVSAEEWERKTPPRQAAERETLAQFFLKSPLRGSGVKIERMKGDLRPVELQPRRRGG